MEAKTSSKKLNKKETEIFLKLLKARFDKNIHRHKNLKWLSLSEKLQANPQKLEALYQMELSGGEPDVVNYNKDKDHFIFMDCSAETPKGRRSCCYDYEALISRKDHPPKHNALDLSKEMGIEMLDESEYHFLQSLEAFDTKTSSWILTPPSIRKLGGAIFGDFRYGQVFIYHNGAASYYAARGFRGKLKV